MIRANARRAALCLALLLAGSGDVFASPVVIDPSTPFLNVSRNLDYLEDRSGALTIAQVADPAGPLRWKGNTRDYFNFGYTASAYWFRLVISNPRGMAGRMLLEIDVSALGRVDCYAPDGRGGYAATMTGSDQPFSSRAVHDRNFIFPIRLDGGDEAYYIRISTHRSLRFRANLHSEEALIEGRNRDNAFVWLVYGMVFLTGVFYLLLFAFLRDRVYLLFSISVCSMFFHQIVFHGFAFQHLWPSYPWLGNKLYPLILSCMGIFPALFVRDMLDTRATSRLFDRLFGLFALVIFPLTALASCAVPYSVILRVDYYFLIAYCVLIIVATLYYLGRGNRFARYLLAGIVGMTIPAMLTMGTALEVFPAAPSARWSMEIGFLLLVLFSSLGLVDRFRIIHRDLESSRKCLADKNRVLTRTNEELRDSLEEKIVLIREVHDRVTGNMEIVRGLLETQAGTVRNSETAQALADATVRLQSMASIHERIYQAGNFSQVDMSSYLLALARRLVEHYASAAGGGEPVRIISSISPVFMPVERAVPFGLLASELLSNAIRHGCRDRAGSVVELGLGCDSDTITMEIADNGPGMDRELFTRGSAGTIGMQIIEALSRQVGAAIELDTGRGTRVTVRVSGCAAA